MRGKLLGICLWCLWHRENDKVRDPAPPSPLTLWPALSQRDLLTDTRLAGTFGDGTARFAAATAAAAERAAVVADSKCAPNSASVEAALDAKTTATRGSSIRKDGEKEDENTRLAGFLSSVLKGMTDVEQLSEVSQSKREASMFNMRNVVVSPRSFPSLSWFRNSLASSSGKARLCTWVIALIVLVLLACVLFAKEPC